MFLHPVPSPLPAALPEAAGSRAAEAMPTPAPSTKTIDVPTVETSTVELPDFSADADDELPRYVGPLITVGVGLGLVGAGVGMLVASEPGVEPCGGAEVEGLCVAGIASMAVGGTTLMVGVIYGAVTLVGTIGRTLGEATTPKPWLSVRPSVYPLGVEGTF
ncbi:MAG: hypothetical protein AAGA56_18605 [Myxococcota bacterium]